MTLRLPGRSPARSRPGRPNGTSDRAGPALAVAVGAIALWGGVSGTFIGLARSVWPVDAASTPGDLLLLLGCTLGGVLSVWLGLGCLLSALGEVSGALGAVSSRLALRWAPGLVRSAVSVLVGAVVGTTASPGAGVAAATDAPSPRPTITGEATSSDPGFHATIHGDPPVPTPAFQSTPTGGYLPPMPRPTTDTVLGPLARPVRAGWAVEEHVIVRRGESLWTITARHLGPHATTAEIAHEWPRWYVANRETIGDDPDHLEPGQELAPPPSRETR